MICLSLFSLGQCIHKPRILFILDLDELIWSRIDASLHILMKFAEGCDRFLIETLVFTLEVAVDFGVAGNMAFVVAKNIRLEEVLSIAARSAPHADDEQVDAF